jgi:hypothetical protein
MPREWAGVTAFVGLFATGTIFMFAPGHVDHHGLIVLLVITALGCAMRMMRGQENVRWGLYAGGIMALGLVVALEILPWLLVMSAVIGLHGAVKGGKAARNGLAYGLALYIGSFVGLLLTRPLAGIFTTLDVLSYSVVYVYLTAGIAVSMAGVAVVAEANGAVRFGLGGALALLTGSWFLHSFPDLITGPYGGMDPALAQIMLGEITETRPLLGGDQGGWMALLAYAASALVALPVGLAFMNYAEDEERWGWRLLMALLAAAFALTAFYQRRFAGVMDALAVIPLAVLLWRGWLWAARKEGRAKVYTELGFLLLAGPLPLLLVPAILDGRSFSQGVLLFPALTEGNPCDMYVLENILRDPAMYGDRPRLIINTMGTGPELLFRTPHMVLSAPFHMDVGGNLDATRFFATTVPAEAEAIARRHKADLVIACHAVPDVYLEPSKDGAQAKNEPHFIQLLMVDRAPLWLKRVRFKGLDNYVVYEVEPPVAVPSLKTNAPRGR